MKPEIAVYNVIAALAVAIDRDTPITIMLVFARVAACGDAGVFQNAVQKELGLTAASMTRAVQTLSDLHYSKSKPGLGLISRHMAFAHDSRNHILTLTPKGRSLADAAASTLVGSDHEPKLNE